METKTTVQELILDKIKDLDKQVEDMIKQFHEEHEKLERQIEEIKQKK